SAPPRSRRAAASWPPASPAATSWYAPSWGADRPARTDRAGTAGCTDRAGTAGATHETGSTRLADLKYPLGHRQDARGTTRTTRPAAPRGPPASLMPLSDRDGRQRAP